MSSLFGHEHVQAPLCLCFLLTLKSPGHPSNLSRHYPATATTTNSTTATTTATTTTTTTATATATASTAGNFLPFDILTWVDQTSVFAEVHSAIQRGESVIIFPEGGSHDNADLLPLKGGVASIAYGSLSENVCIVPVGLNYFRGHRFRGRVVVEYGAPIYITKEMALQVQTNKREAYTQLLSDVADGMRSVLVTADSYDDLKLIHTARRLYQRSATILTTQRRQDLARRFSMGHRILKERFSASGVPRDLQELVKELEECVVYAVCLVRVVVSLFPCAILACLVIAETNPFSFYLRLPSFPCDIYSAPS